jgi:hypothetical protein
MTLRLSRRAALATAVAGLGLERTAHAFGEAGAFRARLLLAGKSSPGGPRVSGAARWGAELARRTSAPAALLEAVVGADKPALLAEPFAVWSGAEDVGPLSLAERGGLLRFLKLGGTLVVDDAAPERGVFGRSVRRELLRVVPESPPVRLPPTHVVYKTFYLVERPVGRVLGTPHIDAIVRGRNAQVLFLAHDLLGALAHDGTTWSLPVEPSGSEQRERAIRFAVNIAMYVLCSDYKDDVVHAPFLLQRRGRGRP